MLYYEFYGLKADPFIKNAMIGRQSFESRDFENAAEQLRSAVERNGVALITATPGLGKSHTIDRFLSSLDSTKNYAAYICPAFVSAIEFYRLLSTALGLDPSGNRQRLVSRIKSHILTTYRRGRSLVLVIDEAQDLKLDILNQLHILLNFEHDSVDAFTLILSGSPSLNETMETRESLTALKQRITNHYDYVGLADAEIPLYLRHKLEFAGGNNLMIDETAIKILCPASHGISRTIDHIMSDALAYGAQRKKSSIDGEVMQFAVDNQSLVARKRFSEKTSVMKSKSP